MKRLSISSLLLLVLLPLSAMADPLYPGKGVVLQPARASWESGFFQEALVRRGLESLGFSVRPPKTLLNAEFYTLVAEGAVDYWTNGWFPTHNAQLPKGFYRKAAPVGTLIRAGGMQGYLASKREVERLDITSLADFTRPEVKAAFDRDGDGMADLVACPEGWGCAGIIAHHLKAYDLESVITPHKGPYSIAMGQTVALHEQGRPILFYTWSPNWTLDRLKPGRDVLWINVPEILPTDAQKPRIERMTLDHIPGAVTDPTRLGFVVSDIRIVANRKRLAAHPAMKRFFSAITLDIDTISEQNTRMYLGEDRDSDIARHVDDWISNHKETWEDWLARARAPGPSGTP